MDEGTTVYILGAGCSVSAGYPLARDFVSGLEMFGSTLGEGCERLKRGIKETVDLMRRVNAETVDDLVSRIDKGAVDELGQPQWQQNSRRYYRILDAKIATTVFFLSKEEHARRTGLRNYHELIHSLFPKGTNWIGALRNSRCRVLSFNYDRLFESAFCDRFPEADRQYLLYGEDVLNSGLSTALGDAITFAPNRFSFLKLHGSVGMRFGQRHDSVRYYAYLDGDVREKKVIISDHQFYGNEKNPNPDERDPEPLIVFPHEKHYTLAGQREVSLHSDYIQKVWRQAKALISEASRIFVIGYSFHPFDRDSFVDLLRHGRRCKELVIRNVPDEAQRICHMLKCEHDDFNLKVTRYPCPF
jgi:hypothetical protein